MKISRNIMQWYGGQGLDTPTEELVAEIGAQLGAVEEVIETGPKYDGIVVAKVVSCVDHPDADRLHVCLVDDGGAVKDVPRKDGYVEVVCGAPNVHEGMTVAWIPPGVTVPSTADKDPFVLEAREIRGTVSNGMLASAKELGISDSHEGLLEITAEDVGEERIKPGTPFKQLYGLDDLIIDIENKMFTHRPDCFGQLGVSREIAGIQHKQFKSPDWYTGPKLLSGGTSDAIKQVTLTNEVPELCPRYMLAAIDNVKIGPSPIWMQAFLTRVGVRPINNIVDLTNYMMLLTGQPLHAFDFDKVAKDGVAQIVVRKPHKGETLGLLDGRTLEPRADAILICDDEKPIGLGGMMGGNNSEIDENTTRILIECATFDMYNIRRSSMEHGIFTDAVTRFTKGQSPWQCPAVLYQTISMIQEQRPEAVLAGEVIDFMAQMESAKSQTIPRTFINERLGLDLTAEDMQNLLSNVEFTARSDGEDLTVTPPFWRTDIEIPEDIVEEVGRLYGYDNLRLILPRRDLTATQPNSLFTLKKQIRDSLSRAGANEILSYSFVHGNLLDKTGQDKEQAFRLSNALSPDLQYFRMSLMPSLLEKVHSNIKAGYEELALFELGKTHIKNQSDPNEQKVPMERQALALVFAASSRAADSYKGAAYYHARKYLDTVLLAFHQEGSVSYEALSEAAADDSAWSTQLTAPFEPRRSALVRDDKGTIWGIVGEYKASVRKNLKLPALCAGFEINPLLLTQANSRQSAYHQLPRFPKVEQDITLRVSNDIAFSGLAELLRSELGASRPDQTYYKLTPAGIYQKDDDHKNISFRLEIASYERTLTAGEVNKLLDTVAMAAQKALRAERV